MKFLLPLVLILVMGSGVAQGASWMFRGSYYTYSPKRGETGQTDSREKSRLPLSISMVTGTSIFIPEVAMNTVSSGSPAMTNEQRAEELINTALSVQPKFSAQEKIAWCFCFIGLTRWQHNALKELIGAALDAEKKNVIDALRSLVQQQSDWIEKIVSVADIEDDCQIIGLRREVIETGYKLLVDEGVK